MGRVKEYYMPEDYGMVSEHVYEALEKSIEYLRKKVKAQDIEIEKLKRSISTTGNRSEMDLIAESVESNMTKARVKTDELLSSFQEYQRSRNTV